MNYPKISVITPSYNSGKYIEDAINSVLAQNYPNFEHVIADGGSTDNTIEILKKYPHLKWISEPDKGQSDAMNKGFKMSSGEIIVYLNADDFFEHSAFSNIVHAFEKNPDVDMIIGNLKMKYDDGREVITGTKFEPDLYNMLKWWKSDSYPYNPVSYFYWRRVQEIMNAFNVDNHINMDYEFLLESASKFKIKKIDNVLGIFRFTEGCKTFNSTGKYLTTKYNYTKKYWSMYPLSKRLSLYFNHYAQIYGLNKYINVPCRAAGFIHRRAFSTIKILKLNYLLKRRLLHSKVNYEHNKTLEFINNQKVDDIRFKHSKSVSEPTLYSLIYVVALLDLYGTLEEIPDTVKSRWSDHLNSFQCEDGLFRDPSVANDIAETEDWWGWRHLTCHAIIALTALNVRASKTFEMLEFLYREGEVEKWLESRDWKNKPDFVSNEILNYGTLLQYARDFHRDERASKALQGMYDWLDEHQAPKTGLWGPAPGNKYTLSIGVQTAYHIWLLYFYDKRPIQYIEKCIDSCLATQNKFGGFGVPLNSSACEDIDSIDPLVRFYFITDYRHDDIKKALLKAYKWVLVNMNEDGGFVFRRGEPLIYGHELMSSKADESAMFPTWFRTLSLAYISKVVDEPELKKIDWNFVDCPGYQFWRDHP